jgi:CheY-like chemotaxis protein
MRSTPLSEPIASAATILVAEDKCANLELPSGLLQVKGYEVVSVIGGEQALQTLRSKPIDLLLRDVRMVGWFPGGRA